MGLSGPLSKGLVGLSFCFHPDISALVGNPSYVTDYQVSQRLRKDASTRRLLKSGKFESLLDEIFFQRFKIILFSDYKSQNGPKARGEKAPSEISEGLGGQAGSQAYRYKSLFQSFEKLVLNASQGKKQTRVPASPLRAYEAPHAFSC